MIINDNYCIKKEYRSNPPVNLTIETIGNQYWDRKRQKTAASFQYHVYLKAKRIVCKYKLPNVIDIGCGPGIKANKFLKPICRRLVGIDQESAIKLCKMRYPQIEFYEDNFEQPNLNLETNDLANQFDFIVCSDVIEHLSDPDILIDYIKQFARNLAFLLISTPERDALRGIDSMDPPQSMHIREWNQEEFRQYLTSRKLEVLEHILLPPHCFNLPEINFRSFIKALKKRFSHPTCQAAVCRIKK